ncbi:MAG: MFS transporter [Planctomycetes bacterium]|nr:MFS transporter [Planctomycetota bacterium]
MIGILFFHTVNTYMDRACISSATGAMQKDLGITDQTMGYIFGVFAIGYALFQIPSGWLADVLGPRKVLAWVVSLWSIFTMLTGAAFNAFSLVLIRFLFGIGEAGAFPGATRALYNWVPAKERGIAQGLFHSGARVGAAFSLFLMPFLITLVGWRFTFVINGVIGVVWVTLWLSWFRNDPKDHHSVNAAELDYIKKGMTEESVSSAKVPFAVIVTSRNMLLAMFQYIASNITFFISFTWLQPYMIRHWGPQAAIYAPIPLIFGMFAHWTSGALVTFLYGKGYHVNSRRIPAVTGFVIGALGLILTTQASASSPREFVLCFSIAVFGVELTLSPSWSFCMDIGGSKSGAVSGSMNMLGNLGSAFSAIVFPYFVANVTLPYFAETTGTANSFFIFAAIINVLAAVAWLFMNPKKAISDSISPRQVRIRLVLFIIAAVLLVGGLLTYKIFFLK